jgi:nucleotide-binding universal stress UspA family protein
MNVRYQVTIVSVGAELGAERAQLEKAVVEMGHFPVDLTATRLLDRELGTLRRHIDRSDYLVVLMALESESSDTSLERVKLACDLAVEHSVPLLCLVVVGGESQSSAPKDVLGFLEKLQASPVCTVEKLDSSTESSAEALIRLIDAFRRPGWVSAKVLPGDEVATELARLAKENAELRKELPSVAEREGRQVARLESMSSSLEANRILIPLWERAASTWGKPVEMSLYDFFQRLAPELAVETSTSAASEYIPIGVCELDPGGIQARWVVPLHDINLWLTDLMALGLVRPSRRRRHAKDANQYWRLTRTGRLYLAHVRRTALETGGHRHVGFTSEYPIMLEGTGDGPPPPEG